MKFTGEKCPCCEKEFIKGDDVVVCPECGTPHHRDCYINNSNTCCNASKHKEGFVYKSAQDTSQTKENQVIVCPTCKTPNDALATECSRCGEKLGENKNESDPFKGAFGQNGQQMPFFMDPLAGVDANEKFEDDITVGETAKYVKQNTPYFIYVFNSIKKHGKSRFNFSAALFSGIYLLYRKQYVLGFIVTLLQLLITTVTGLIMNSDLYMTFFEIVMSGKDATSYIMNLSLFDSMLIMLPSTLSAMNFAIAIVLGFTENRLYFKHCRKKINQIKSKTKDENEISKQLQTKGGVNIALTISLLVTFVIVRYGIYFYGGLL